LKILFLFHFFILIWAYPSGYFRLRVGLCGVSAFASIPPLCYGTARNLAAPTIPYASKLAGKAGFFSRAKARQAVLSLKLKQPFRLVF